MKTQMSFNDINPFVRYAGINVITINNQFLDLVSYDYRLFYCLKGSGYIHIDDNLHKMSTGSILMTPPGYTYSLLIGKDSHAFELINVNFDFTHNFEHLTNPIAPAKWRNFKQDQILEVIEFTDLPDFNLPLHMDNLGFLNTSMNRVVSDYILKKNFFRMRIAGILLGNLAIIARLSADKKHPRRSEMVADKVIKYILANYKDNISNEFLGEKFGYHPNHLNRLMVLNTGMTIHQFIISCRIDAAIELIQTSDLKIAEISELVGFSDPAHFVKYFKKKTGKTTKDFRS